MHKNDAYLLLVKAVVSSPDGLGAFLVGDVVAGLVPRRVSGRNENARRYFCCGSCRRVVRGNQSREYQITWRAVDGLD